MRGLLGAIAFGVALSSLPAFAQDEPMDDATAAYYIELFCDMAYQEPAANQAEMVDALGNISLRYRPRPFAPQTPEHEAYLARLARETYAETRALYAVIELVYQNGALAFLTEPATLDLATGLPRPILVEVTNRAARPIVVNATFGMDRTIRTRNTRVPPGETRAELTSLTAEDESPTEAHLGVVVGEEPFNLPIPIRVQAPARLLGTILDEDTSRPFPGRVYARGGDGHLRHGTAFADTPTLSEKQMLTLTPAAHRMRRLPFFYSDGRFEVLLPAGEAEVTLERGFEHEIVRESLSLAPAETREIELESGRFVDMRRKGWWSGDTHVHWAKNWWSENEDMGLLAIVQRAEDVRVVNNLTLRHHNPVQGEFIAPTQYPMGPIEEYSYGGYHAVMGEEYRNQPFYGHLLFLNIKRLIRPISTGEGIMGPGAFDYPTNRSRILRARRQGGISIEAHGLAGESPANIIDGLADSLDQINPDDYYRVLDAGFRLPLTNGGDHPARLVGYVRCYVKVDGNFTYEKWIQGIRDCRTFTTSGPLLLLEINGRDIGDEVRVDSGDALHIKAKLRTRHPVRNFQVVANHKVLADVPVDGDQGEIELEIPAEESCWVVARASSIDNYNALYGEGIAHTSAIYVIVDDRPILKPEAARALAQQLRRQVEVTDRDAHFGSDEQRREALDIMQRAIEAYEQLAHGELAPGS